MKEPKNACSIGDRVEDNNTKSLGIVIDLDIIKNEGGYEPRAKIHWTDCSKSLIGKLEDKFTCERNITILSPRENLLHRNY
jgi:hypothetical protein